MVYLFLMKVDERRDNMYRLELIMNEISTEELNKLYLSQDKFWGFCKACPKFDQFWACPSYSFDVLDYINEYQFATIIGVKIHIDSMLIELKKENQEVNELSRKILDGIRQQIDESLLTIESNYPNTRALFAGACKICPICTKSYHEPCCNLEKMRYSLESFGYDVGEISKNVLHSELLWGNGNFPAYYILVSAVLSKESLKSLHTFFSKIK